MSASFFQAFWKLISSQLTEASEVSNTSKLMKDVFSTTFARAWDFADPAARSSFLDLLESKMKLVANRASDDAANEASLAVLIEWLRLDRASPVPPSSPAACAFVNAVILPDASSVEAQIATIGSPIVVRVLSHFLAKESLNQFILAVESNVIPRLVSDEEKSKLLAVCPVLSQDIESLMNRTVSDISEWIKLPPTHRVLSDLELTLTVVAHTSRIVRLFRQVPNIPVLKEQFLVTLAVGLRAAQHDLPALVEEVRKLFFYIPSVGVVMDRWLDKELKKYNGSVTELVRDNLSSSGQAGLEQLRAAIRSCFLSPDATVTLPHGIEAAVCDFLLTGQKVGGDEKSAVVKFKPLPCGMSMDTAKFVLSFFPGWFDVVGTDTIKLSSTARASWVAVTAATTAKVDEVVTGADTIGDAGPKHDGPTSLASEVVTASGTTNSSTAGPGQEDLVDILLREILNRLPQHAFLSKSYPKKVQAGVYRFGAREITFHTSGGNLFVYRVGGYVAEGDALEFIAKEFGVPTEKLVAGNAEKKAAAVDVPTASSSVVPLAKSVVGVVGMRRPMEWDNTELLGRIVRRGLRAKDYVWKEGWDAFCRSQELSDKDPTVQSQSDLATFLEQNIAHAARQDWARDLLYYCDEQEPRRREKRSRSRSRDRRDRGDAFGGRQVPIGTTVAPTDVHPNYKTRMCVNFPLGKCTRGSACAYAHGPEELRSGTFGVSGQTQAQFFKTRICNLFIENRCTRGSACSYAHSEAERLSYASGVVRRDVKSSQDVRLEEKRKALAKVGGGRSRSRSPRPARSSAQPSYGSNAAVPSIPTTSSSSKKPLPYIPPPRASQQTQASAGAKSGSKINEDEL